MQNEIRWLVRLGFDQGLFTREHAAAVRDALPADVGLMDFAQKLIDEGYVADSQLELLEQIAGLAFTKGKAGVAQGIARIEVEAAGRPYVGNATSKLNATPTSATTRATFQAAVDDLVRALAADPDAASAEPPPSTKKRR